MIKEVVVVALCLRALHTFATELLLRLQLLVALGFFFVVCFVIVSEVVFGVVVQVLDCSIA